MSASIRLREIAALVDGRLVGDGDLEITSAATIRNARPGEITLADSAALHKKLSGSQASAVVVPEDFAPEGIAYVAVADVHKSFASVVRHFRPPRETRAPRIHPAAHISPSANIGEGVSIGIGAIVGDDVTIGPRAVIHERVCIEANCRIGEETEVFAGAIIHEGSIVGPRCSIGANSVIGGHGFGYKTIDGRHRRLHQLGYVELEADVDIGANTTIDRGTYDATLIGEGSKIDNLVMIAHNCRIGRYNIICAQVGLAGSSVTGDYVVLAGQVGIADHLEIGDGSKIGAKSGVINHVPPGAKMLGMPACPERQQHRMVASLARVPEMRKKIREMHCRIDALEQGDAASGERDAA